jgi:hypothetical protein
VTVRGERELCERLSEIRLRSRVRIYEAIRADTPTEVRGIDNGRRKDIVYIPRIYAYK